MRRILRRSSSRASPTIATTSTRPPPSSPPPARPPPLADAIDELIYRLSRSLHNTTVSVTHDMIAAKYFGDRIGLMQDGKIVLERNVDEIDATDHEMIQSFLHRKEHHD